MNGRPDGKGQALAEFALTAPIFFLLVFGVIQLGLLFGAQNGLVDAVRDSTRRAATYRVNQASLVGVTLSGICSVIRSEVDARLRERVPGYVAGNATTTITYEWEANNDSPQKSWCSTATHSMCHSSTSSWMASMAWAMESSGWRPVSRCALRTPIF
jgi:Flp pilus assembly protein TadG